MSSTTETLPGYTTGAWTIDLVHSEVGFSVRHMMVSKVRGKFTTFEVDTHPTMTFTSTGIRANGGGYMLDGDLTIKGVTKAVSFELELGGFGPDAYGGTRAGFSATTIINRRDFGVDFNATIEAGGVVVADKVTVNLEIELVLNVA